MYHEMRFMYGVSVVEKTASEMEVCFCFSQNDNYGYKARPQMLAEKKQRRVNVWNQIGAPEPKVAAAKLMKQNDNFGYKVRHAVCALRIVRVCV